MTAVHAIRPTVRAGWAEWSSWLDADGAPAFSVAECDQIIEIADKRAQRPGTIGHAGDLDPATRTVDIVDLAFDDASWLYEKLETIARDVNDTFWHLDLTHMDNVEVLRYEAGGHYVEHVDWTEGFTTRKLSVVVMLSEPDDYEGGDLLIRSRHDPFIAPRARGAITVFPSWTLHAVTPVAAGVRQVATCWVHGPPYR